MKNQNFKIKTTWILLLLILFVVGYGFLVTPTHAQDISLSITPPILEVMIQPGKEITQNYLISNNGNETPLKISIVPFSPSDEYGNVELEDITNYNDINILNWFKIGGTPLDENQKIFIPRGGNQEIILTISPPLDAPEGDYYLTLLFETDSSSLIGGRTTQTQAQIGSNILFTVSKDGNPRKDAEITLFSAPKIIDSLGQIIYTVKIKNTGSAFFKPIGKINISHLFGSEETLTIAPQNILASSIREIPCTKEEELIRCSLTKKVLFGIYRGNLKFQLDDGSESYESYTTTIAFPFSISVAFLIVFIIIRTIILKFKK